MTRKKNDLLRSDRENFRRKKVNDSRGWSKRMMKKLETLKEAGADGTTSVSGVCDKEQEQ